MLRGMVRHLAHLRKRAVVRLQAHDMAFSRFKQE
jgi:hypothetical protein